MWVASNRGQNKSIYANIKSSPEGVWVASAKIHIFVCKTECIFCIINIDKVNLFIFIFKIRYFQQNVNINFVQNYLRNRLFLLCSDDGYFSFALSMLHSSLYYSRSDFVIIAKNDIQNLYTKTIRLSLSTKYSDTILYIYTNFF